MTLISNLAKILTLAQSSFIRFSPPTKAIFLKLENFH